MIANIQYTNIRRVLDNLLDHPLLRDVSLEQAVRYTIRFISLHGYPALYKDRIKDIEIENYRGVLPCDLISIIQVKNLKSNVCMRAMTDNFNPSMDERKRKEKCTTLTNNVIPNPPMVHSPAPYGMDRCCPEKQDFTESSFKTQGRIIYTSFPGGHIQISYKAIPVDDDGYPLLIDNEVYLAALEAYIKKQVFTIKFDTGKINAGVLQNAQQEYAWLAGQLQDEMTIPSVSEMEAITRMWNTMIPSVRQFDSGFKHLGDREYLRLH